MAHRSLVPTIFGRDYMDALDLVDPFRPAFAIDPWRQLEDPFLDLRRAMRSFDSQLRRLQSETGQAQIQSDKDSFQVKLDVSHFRPEEIEVKVVGNDVTIHGRHEERRDDHGYVSREFTRRYHLPEGCDIDRLSSSLSPNGVLQVTAPKKPIEGPKGLERQIPIQISSGPTNLAIQGDEKAQEKKN